MTAMASTLSNDEILHLAKLSNIELTKGEISLLKHDLSAILSYINSLSELDTEGIEPTYQVTGLKNVFRDDALERDSVERDVLLDLAPDREDNQIKVPKVL